MRISLEFGSALTMVFAIFLLGCASESAADATGEERSEELTDSGLEICPKYDPVDKDFYPLSLVKGHRLAAAPKGYATRVRKAVAASLDLIWQRKDLTTGSETNVDRESLRHGLLVMHCLYTGAEHRLGSLRSVPLYEHGMGHWIAQSQFETLLKEVISIEANHGRMSSKQNPPVQYKVPGTAAGYDVLYKELPILNASSSYLPYGVYAYYQQPKPGWSAVGYMALDPAGFDDALDKLAELINEIRAIRDDPNKESLSSQARQLQADRLGAELAFILANFLPFGSKSNWGILHTVLAMARRYVLEGLVEPDLIDRGAWGIDQYLIYVVATQDDALTVYKAWQAGILDEEYLGDNLSEEDDWFIPLPRHCKEPGEQEWDE